MAERAPWWRAFLVKRKSSKDTAGPALDPDFNPFETKPKDPTPTNAAAKSPKVDRSAPQAQTEDESQTTKGTSLLSDETFDDSKLESVFNEQTCRRNMRVSRSGRFKEKRRVRSTLPLEEQEAADKLASGKEERR